MLKQPRIFRVVKKVIRLNVNSPRTMRVAVVRVVPLLISAPHDLTSIEQIAACDALTIGIQVGMVMYGLAIKSTV
jgi:hypothetical protein